MRAPHVGPRPAFKPEEISALVHHAVLDAHFDDVSFLWLLRDRAVCAPHIYLLDLLALDERIEAHLDGMRVAGPHGWELCASALSEADPGVVFASGVLALESGDSRRIDVVVAAAQEKPEATRGLISAIAWSPFDRVAPWLTSLLGATEPELQRLSLAGHAAQRRDPGDALTDACRAENARLRARAFRAAGELGRRDAMKLLVDALTDADPQARFEAAFAAARLGAGEPALTALQAIALRGGANAERAAEMFARAAPLDLTRTWLAELWQKPELRRLAARAAGASGDLRFVDPLIEWMEDDELCRVAGSALSILTGVDLAYLDLDRDAPEGHEGGPSDAPEDEDVELDPDEDLEWPQRDAVAAWWSTEAVKFAANVRYLWGKPKSEPALWQTLGVANQPGRAAAALELGLQSNAPLVDVRAPGACQQAAFGPWIARP